MPLLALTPFRTRSWACPFCWGRYLEENSIHRSLTPVHGSGLSFNLPVAAGIQSMRLRLLWSALQGHLDVLHSAPSHSTIWGSVRSSLPSPGLWQAGSPFGKATECSAKWGLLAFVTCYSGRQVLNVFFASHDRDARFFWPVDDLFWHVHWEQNHPSTCEILVLFHGISSSHIVWHEDRMTPKSSPRQGVFSMSPVTDGTWYFRLTSSCWGNTTILRCLRKIPEIAVK